MASKLNPKALHNYSERVAQELCDSFFDKVPVVHGKHLLHFSDVKQINYFLVKLLFQKWLEEGEHLQSPYFDYSAPDVQEAFAYLNNVLSHHIQIKRTYFEPLLAEAVADTLRLSLAPYTFFDKEFERFGAHLHVQRDFLALCRYIRIHGLLRDSIYNKLKNAAKNQVIGTEDAKELIIQAMDELSDFDDPKPILRYFNQIIAFRLQDLVKKEEEEKPYSLTTPTVPPLKKPDDEKVSSEIKTAATLAPELTDQTLYSAEQTYIEKVVVTEAPKTENLVSNAASEVVKAEDSTPKVDTEAP
ncbi:MAG: hypothetical protein EAZ57_11700, partial [Cytophagales bacterium]